MNKIFSFPLVAAILLMNIASYGQELPRSASFGALVSDLNDSIKVALNLSSPEGSLIKKVVAGSSAQKANFIVNDVLVSINGQPIKNTNQLLELLKKQHGGDKVKIAYYRKAKLKKTTMTLLPKEMETSTDYKIIYSSASSGNNHLRTIITKPKGNGVYPAVLLIGGVGCYSIDNTTIPEILSIKIWADSLTKNGFVTMRVKKNARGSVKRLEPPRQLISATNRLDP